MILLPLAPPKNVHHPSQVFCSSDPPLCTGRVLQEIRNMHSEQLMGIRREEEMEMSDDDMEDSPDSKDSEDSGMHVFTVSTLLSTRTDHDRQRLDIESVK